LKEKVEPKVQGQFNGSRRAGQVPLDFSGQRTLQQLFIYHLSFG